MKDSVIIGSTLGALGLAVIYDQINQMTGIKIAPLLYLAVITLFIGLSIGLYTNNKLKKKGKV